MNNKEEKQKFVMVTAIVMGGLALLGLIIIGITSSNNTHRAIGSQRGQAYWTKRVHQYKYWLKDNPNKKDVTWDEWRVMANWEGKIK